MAKTNSGLVAYVKTKVGCYYWFGCFGQMASRSLYNSKKAQYPKYYTASDFSKQIANPKQVFDCAGLIKAYLWTKSITDTNPVYKSSQDWGATTMYNQAKSKGSISSFKKIDGQLVFKGNDQKKSHVGVYIGNDYVVEAKGHAYGVVMTKFSSGGWKYWAQYSLITDDTSKPEPQPEPTPEPQPTRDKHSDDYAGIWKVTAHSGLWLRAFPNGEKITCIPFNKHVNCSGDYQTASDGEWLKVTYDGMTGYSFKSYLTKLVEGNFSKEYVGTFKVTAPSGLWMRTGAGTKNDKITCLSFGSKVTCGGFFEDIDGTIWLKVTQGGNTGWSSSDWLRKI